MNLFKKAAPLAVASLLAATSAFGQNNKCPPTQKSFEQGHELMQNQMMAAYNAPARIDVRGAWDFYATGSFTYWQPSQDNMEVGLVNNVITTALTADAFTATNIGPVNADWINMNFDWAPGFKVGLGMNVDHDNWDLFTEYTWFRSSQSQTSTQAVGSRQSILAGQAHGILQSNTAKTSQELFDYAKERWRVNMDFVDVEMARSYYVGKSLSFRPCFGARGAWIRQRMDATYENRNIAAGNYGLTSARFVATANLRVSTDEVTHSWGVGPKAGLYSNWMLGEGFRLFGNGFVDVLYSNYTKLAYKGKRQVTTSTTIQTIHTHQKKLGVLRTHLDLEMGLAWGSYFDNNNWHVDLSAGYGFQVFFDQNMFRNYGGSCVNTSPSTEPSGNLYVQGLTATARFDF